MTSLDPHRASSAIPGKPTWTPVASDILDKGRLGERSTTPKGIMKVVLNSHNLWCATLVPSDVQHLGSEVENIKFIQCKEGMWQETVKFCEYSSPFPPPQQTLPWH